MLFLLEVTQREIELNLLAARFSFRVSTFIHLPHLDFWSPINCLSVHLSLSLSLFHVIILSFLSPSSLLLMLALSWDLILFLSIPPSPPPSLILPLCLIFLSFPCRYGLGAGEPQMKSSGLNCVAGNLINQIYGSHLGWSFSQAPGLRWPGRVLMKTR